jgi:hypothetical protein
MQVRQTDARNDPKTLDILSRSFKLLVKDKVNKIITKNFISFIYFRNLQLVMVEFKLNFSLLLLLQISCFISSKSKVVLILSIEA